MYGVREDDILDMGVTYVLIGHQQIHGQKKIMRRPHHEHNLSFVRSRAKDQSLNRVWIWGNR